LSGQRRSQRRHRPDAFQTSGSRFPWLKYRATKHFPQRRAQPLAGEPRPRPTVSLGFCKARDQSLLRASEHPRGAGRPGQTGLSVPAYAFAAQCRFRRSQAEKDLTSDLHKRTCRLPCTTTMQRKPQKKPCVRRAQDQTITSPWDYYLFATQELITKSHLQVRWRAESWCDASICSPPRTRSRCSRQHDLGLSVF
jgi:hypothetical protein